MVGNLENFMEQLENYVRDLKLAEAFLQLILKCLKVVFDWLLEEVENSNVL